MMNSPQECDSLVIHRARWIIPIEGDPVSNGAVVIFHGKIVDFGTSDDMQSRYLGTSVDHGDAVIIPGLVNAHCHLELSPLKWRLSPGRDMVAWIKSLIQARDQIELSEWAPAIEEALSQLVFEGIVAVGDVGNFDALCSLCSGSMDKYNVEGLLFKELIAPLATKEDAQSMVDGVDLQEINNPEGKRQFNPCRHQRALAAHSPYSVSPWAIKAIKDWDSVRGLPYSIHAAESREEVDFLMTGKGPFRDLLEERGHWPLNFEIPGCSPIEYLHRLGVLDSQTICVHCVNVTHDDIDILAETGIHCCLCPRSNIFLGVGQAPVFDMWKAGINLCLGTDSLASNDRLSIFAEMSSLSRIAPEIAPMEILRAATLGGAHALGIDSRFGSISRGKSSRLLVLENTYSSLHDVVSYLVLQAVHEISETNCYWIG